MLTDEQRKFLATTQSVAQLNSSYCLLVLNNTGSTNDSVLRKKFLDTLNYHCRVGKSNEAWDTFEVICDETNNPPNYVDRSTGWPRVDIYFKVGSEINKLTLEKPEDL